MGRVLVIHSQASFLELVKRVLAGSHKVETIEDPRLAFERLIPNEPYEAVLCDLNEPALTMEVFEKALRAGSVRLVSIASDKTQFDEFSEQWKLYASHQESRATLNTSWLPDHCTAGEILAVIPKPAVKTMQPVEAVDEIGDLPLPAVESGTIIDGYKLLFVIGQGGFGSTWLGINQTTGKRVAVKCVQGEAQINQELAAMCKYVHVAAREQHLLQIEHIDRDDSHLWVVTPLADSLTGGDTVEAYRPLSLASYLDTRGRLPETEAVVVAISIARAVLTLHRAGLLHGDISPFNILRIQHRWVLADPGLVRFIGEHGICRNRAYYPQPKVTRASDDLYAIGLVLWDMTSGIWEMVSGKERLRVDDRMLRHISGKDLPIATVLCRALAENPEQRYMSTEDIVRDLEALSAELAKSRLPDTLYAALRLLRTN